MREIKFRYVLKHRKDGILRIGLFDIDDIEQGESFSDSEWELISRDQYTGFEDKNGVEIYEGDILQDVLINMDYDVWIIRSEVMFDDISASFMLKNFWERTKRKNSKQTIEKKPKVQYSRMDDILRTEVIGNIYQNPELLETT